MISQRMIGLGVAVLFAVALSARAESDAEAGAGWYRLEPPGEDMIWEDSVSMPFVRTDSQLSRWRHLGSYDTAEECERGNQKNWYSVGERQMALDKQFPKGLPKVKEKALTLSAAMAMDARCVASDDPRLLGK